MKYRLVNGQNTTASMTYDTLIEALKDILTRVNAEPLDEYLKVNRAEIKEHIHSVKWHWKITDIEGNEIWNELKAFYFDE